MSASPNDLGQTLIKRVAKPNVSDHASLEKCEGSHALGAVDDLVRHNEVAGPYLFLQRSDGREGNDSPYANVSQRGDVGAVLHLMRGVFVVEAVAGEEGYWDRLAGGGRRVLQDADGGRGLAPWRVDIECRSEGEARQRGNARAAYDGDVDGYCGDEPGSARVGSGRRAPSNVFGTPAILRYGIEMERLKTRGMKKGVSASRSIHCGQSATTVHDKQFLSRRGSSCRPWTLMASFTQQQQHPRSRCIYCSLPHSYHLFKKRQLDQAVRRVVL